MIISLIERSILYEMCEIKSIALTPGNLFEITLTTKQGTD